MPAKKAARKVTKKRPPPGRRTLVTPSTLATIKKLAAHGFLANEIADILGVTRMTMWRWRAQLPEVADALSIGHRAANDRVELSIYQMAIGYDRDEIEIKVINGQVVEVPVKRYYPPNPQAAAFWARHKMQWGEDMPPAQETTDESKPIEIRQVARQVARLLHLANKPETQQ